MTDHRARIDAWRDRHLDGLGFILDGERYDVPLHPARVWVLAALSDEAADLCLDVLPDQDDADLLWEAATDPDDDLTTDQLRRIGRALLGEATGRPWWQATQLIAELVYQWDVFLAVARDRGLGNPLEWPIEDLCSWVYLRITQHAKKEDRASIDAALSRPPAVLDAEGDEDDDAAPPDGWDEASGWHGLALQAGVPLPAD